LFAIEAVERHSGERAGQHRGDGARQQDAAHHQSRRVVATARLKTATLLKWSPISLTTCPIQV
jgi:hypothetical protein